MSISRLDGMVYGAGARERARGLMRLEAGGVLGCVVRRRGVIEIGGDASRHLKARPYTSSADRISASQPPATHWINMISHQ